ncbi:3-hydroxyacyl-CoA dehydrogenase NAD-binding domain-containing protein [uncultured Paraglaciecola sp.]|uniref:3-hydroxyacyl-CoA dehydrogenase family protein n=1 Tax=uncultured Paraglaciecola sp. TaxID=1765024 RepID=UPI002596EBB6|nr:3-hydroxyacyl-CoA dehydrogenase NAD-binding domain-containing protein [uncultured Paraglaciecola sp.]
MFKNSNVTVIGAGLMGCGIAQVFAVKNIQVTIYDPIAEARGSAKDKIAANLTSLNMSHASLGFIQVTGDMQSAISNADFIIEAAPEKLAIKQKIFADILPFVEPTTIVASNTSVIPIVDIFSGLNYQDQVVGTHWWNPPYLVPLVEVVQSEQSSEQAVNTMMELLTYVGKTPVHIQKDVPGFVGNRMQHALWREAIALINDGVCSPEGIDLVVKNSFGLRLPVLGPIENADLVGLDLTLDIHNVILPSINNQQSPADVLKHKVADGNLGMKSGKGFIQWSTEKAQGVRDNLNQYLLNAQNKREKQDET